MRALLSPFGTGNFFGSPIKVCVLAPGVWNRRPISAGAFAATDTSRGIGQPSSRSAAYQYAPRIPKQGTQVTIVRGYTYVGTSPGHSFSPWRVILRKPVGGQCCSLMHSWEWGCWLQQHNPGLPSLVSTDNVSQVQGLDEGGLGISVGRRPSRNEFQPPSHPIANVCRPLLS